MTTSLQVLDRERQCATAPLSMEAGLYFNISGLDLCLMPLRSIQVWNTTVATVFPLYRGKITKTAYSICCASPGYRSDAALMPIIMETIPHTFLVVLVRRQIDGQYRSCLGAAVHSTLRTPTSTVFAAPFYNCNKTHALLCLPSYVYNTPHTTQWQAVLGLERSMNTTCWGTDWAPSANAHGWWAFTQEREHKPLIRPEVAFHSRGHHLHTRAPVIQPSGSLSNDEAVRKNWERNVIWVKELRARMLEWKSLFGKET